MIMLILIMLLWIGLELNAPEMYYVGLLLSAFYKAMLFAAKINKALEEVK